MDYVAPKKYFRVSDVYIIWITFTKFWLGVFIFAEKEANKDSKEISLQLYSGIVDMVVYLYNLSSYKHLKSQDI